MCDYRCPSSTLFRESTHRGRRKEEEGGDVHDKSNRTMSKHFIRRQLPGSFLPACGLKSYNITSMSAFERLNKKFKSRTFCNALSMFTLGTPPARAFLMTLKSATFFSGSIEPPTDMSLL
jgi:hypothetical protein